MPNYENRLKTVALIFRRPAAGGYFSIERSFTAIGEHLESGKKVALQKIVANQLSKGLIPRLKILWQMARLSSQVCHISGDIHFAALATPKQRTILTIHDCGFMQHPNPLARLLLGWFWLKWPVRRSRFITAVSQTTKDAIVHYTACSPEKITVIPSVIPEHFKPCPREFCAENPRILHLGSAPNKNMLRHIEALEGLSCTLHLVAELGPEEKQLLEHQGVAYDCTPNLSDTALAQAYENCDLLLFASTLEGFGMPILEAQSVGRPVVTSNCSSMPEVAGAGACLVDPLDVISIRNGLQRVIQDAAYRQKLVQSGFQNIRRFQAKNVAEQYLQLYQSILEEA